MEIGELVAPFTAAVNADKYCDAPKTKNKPWQARINQWGSKGEKCSGGRLYDNMAKSAKSGVKEGYLGPPQPFVAKPAGTGHQWDLDGVDKTHFPIQAHHIIPKNHLPDHYVCAFLAKKFTKHPKFELTDDTFYDTDHANNGYCMPYATPLKEWKDAKGDDDVKTSVAYLVMKRTLRQLHQGSHRAESYAAPPADSEDDGQGGDDEAMHADGAGYLDTIDDFLNVVQAGAELHSNDCEECGKPSGKKRKLDPLEAAVRHIDQVSGVIKLLVDGNRIFVSELAYNLWNARKKRMKLPNWLKKYA